MYIFRKSTFIMSLSIFGGILFGQGMPIDKTTGKVTYTGEVRVPNITKAELTDKIAQFLSGYTPIRGSVNSLYVKPDNSLISGVFVISATASTKSMLWLVNAAFTIQITDGAYIYSITNLYVYASTVSYIYGNEVLDGYIEVSDGFNVNDFKMKNNNALNTHNAITKIIEDLGRYLIKI